ncbi:MAG: hypothetical protein IKR74_02185 [Bacilli bacterium]|nr:hypothetical protein [Bacilli bacterium]
MKKSYLILGIILLLIIGVIIFSKFNKNDDSYYLFVADTIISFYKTDKYDEKKIRKEDKNIIDEYLSHLTHNDEEILLDDYIIRSNAYYTTDQNTSGVYVKNGKCYIKYRDIGFDKYYSEDYEIEPNRQIICNNYLTILYESYFYPDYSVTVNNPKYDYYFVSSTKNMSTYTYWYKSTYDNTELKVIIVVSNGSIFNIKTEEVYNEV